MLLHVLKISTTLLDIVLYITSNKQCHQTNHNLMANLLVLHTYTQLYYWFHVCCILIDQLWDRWGGYCCCYSYVLLLEAAGGVEVHLKANFLPHFLWSGSYAYNQNLNNDHHLGIIGGKGIIFSNMDIDLENQNDFLDRKKYSRAVIRYLQSRRDLNSLNVIACMFKMLHPLHMWAHKKFRPYDDGR